MPSSRFALVLPLALVACDGAPPPEDVAGGPVFVGQPNEFLIRVLDAFGVDSAGVWVLDLGNGRLHRFRPDGLGVARPGMAVARGADPFAYGRFPIRRVGPDGEMFGTVLTTAVPYDPDVPTGHFSPLSTGPVHALARDGDGAFRVERDPDGSPTRGLFRVARVNARGDTRFDRTYGHEPRRVDADAARVEIEETLPGLVARYDGRVWFPDTEPTGGERMLDQAGDELVTHRVDDLLVSYVRRYRLR